MSARSHHREPTCDHALTVSALVDGELAPHATAEAVEHLLDCRQCAAFFRRARALDTALLLTAAEDDARAEPTAAPSTLWARIERTARAEAPEAARPQPVSRSTARRRLLLPAAAALLVGLGTFLGWELAPRLRGVPPSLGPLRGGITYTALGARPPRMDEQRFVAIARELLAADRRYRDAMTGVLAVARSEERTEGSTAESSWREEELRGLSTTRTSVH